MLYAGCDLHKQTISVCVMNPARQIVKRERLRCVDETAIRRFFEELGEFDSLVRSLGCLHPFGFGVLYPASHGRLLGSMAYSTSGSGCGGSSLNAP